MNETNAFSIEMMNKIIKGVSENSDILQLLIQSVDIQEKGIQDIKSDDLEQKITLMVSKLTHIEKSIESEELEDYYGLCQSLYNNWDQFDDLTRKFIPISEYLFSKLQKYNKPDYSPVIIELCRAIENEFLLKIFRKYTLDVIKRKGSSIIDTFLSTDRASKYLCNKTGVFVKAISKAAIKGSKPEYTLGQMNTILSLMNDKNVVSQSPLLQDFESYLASETVTKDLLNIQYIKNINNIVENYRNPSTHPEMMSLDKAQECKEIIPAIITPISNTLSWFNYSILTLHPPKWA